MTYMIHIINAYYIKYEIQVCTLTEHNYLTTMKPSFPAMRCSPHV
jgi:hypothetical protein